MADVLSVADTTVGSGAFNKRVSLQQESLTPDGQGGGTPTWTTLFTTWAHIEGWKGSRPFQAQQLYPEMYTQILLRYRPSQNINASMRVVYGSRIYQIISVVVPAEALTTIKLLCQELQAKGSLH